MLMEGDPFQLIEGMAIAAYAVGAGQGYIYVRSEYPHAIAKLKARRSTSAADFIAPFRLEVRVGAGAYVCGEETSLLNSLEGKRGEVRAKPPLARLEGSVRLSHRSQQRPHPRRRAAHPDRRRRQPL
jgi:formate dehydrogenase iron-sulfur subunit